MAIRKRMCVNHPDRPAIGVCHITRNPVCSECSTRYEGVNYSKEGLRILRERRAAEAKKVGVGHRLASLFVTGLSPLLLYLVYFFYRILFQGLIDLGQLEF